MPEHLYGRRDYDKPWLDNMDRYMRKPDVGYLKPLPSVACCMRRALCSKLCLVFICPFSVIRPPT